MPIPINEFHLLQEHITPADVLGVLATMSAQAATTLPNNLAAGDLGMMAEQQHRIDCLTDYRRQLVFAIQYRLEHTEKQQGRQIRAQASETGDLEAAPAPR